MDTENTINNTQSTKTLQSSWAQFVCKWRYLDRPIIAIVTCIILFSLIMVYSATMYLVEGSASTPTPLHYVIRQFAGVIVGGGLFIMAIATPYKLYTKKKILILINVVVLALLILTLIAGRIGGGAQSWLRIGGFNLQPAEFAKISLMLLVAMVLSETKKEFRLSNAWMREHKVPLILTVSIIMLILLQPDFGMVFILLVSGFVTSVVSGKQHNYWMYVIIAGLYAVLQVASRVFSKVLVASSSYQLKRIGSFVNPFEYRENEGFQLISGYLAISRGGWFGVGLGHGVTKQTSLPAGHTDFILAMVGEELGLIGIMVLLTLMFSLIVLIFRWAAKSVDPFRKSVFIGIGVVLLVQIVINVGGVSGLMPLTGVTLPFMSYGGSSMMVSMLILGVLQAMIIQEKQVAEMRLQAERKDWSSEVNDGI